MWVTILLVAGIALVLAYEVITAIRQSEQTPTITALIRRASSNPVLPFAAGMLCGHFFWN